MRRCSVVGLALACLGSLPAIARAQIEHIDPSSVASASVPVPPGDLDEWTASPPPEAIGRTVRVQRLDEGLAIAGIVHLALGYAAGLVVAIPESMAGACSRPRARMSCDTAGLAAIPLVGGLLAGTVAYEGDTRWENGWGLGVGLPALALQAVGVSLLVAALAHESEELVRETARLSVRPLAEAPGVSFTLEI